MNTLSTIHYPLSTRAVFLITIAFAIALLFPTVFWPFDYDQGTFAYGGAAVLHGARPYLDFWDIKPPNIFYTYATAFALFGNNVRAVRIFDYLNALVTIALLFLLSVRLWKNAPWRNLAAVIASLAFILQYYIFGHWNTAQTETYSLPLLIAALLLVIPGNKTDFTRTIIRAVIAGALIGISFYFKFPNAIFLLLAATTLWMYSGAAHRIKSISWLIAGFVALVGIESLYLELQGELLPLWHITISETASYVSANYSGSFGFLNNLRTASQALDLAWTVAGIIGWILWTVNRSRSETDKSILRSIMLLLLGIILSLIAVQLGNKGYTYHYAILLPWADVLIGAGIALAINALSQFRLLPRTGYAIVIILLLCSISYFWSSANPLQSRMKELISIANGNEAPNGYIAGDTLSNYVIQHSRPNDTIFIFGFQPYIYWKTGRTPATKFLNTIHFKPSGVNPAEREELVHTLLGNPPVLFLVENNDRYTSQGNTNDDSRTAIRLRYPELEQLLNTRYWPEDTLQHTIIYHRR